MDPFVIVNLEAYFNIKGISTLKNINSADFSGLGSSYPAEELPKKGVTTINDTPFLFPDSESIVDSLTFDEQLIKLPRGLYKRLHILGAADNGSFREKVYLVDGIKKSQIKVGLTGWIVPEPHYSEKKAFICSMGYSQSEGIVREFKPIIWHQTVDLNNVGDIEFLQLSDNPAMHLFAITLEKGD